MLKGIEVLHNKLKVSSNSKDDYKLKLLIEDNNKLQNFLREYNVNPRNALINLDEMFMLKIIKDDLFKERLLNYKRINDEQFINDNITDLNKLKDLIANIYIQNNQKLESLNKNEVSYYLLKKLNDKEIITDKDYELIDMFIDSNFNEDIVQFKDIIFTSINLFNAEKLKELYIMPKIQINKTKIEKPKELEEKEVTQREILNVDDEISEVKIDNVLIEKKENRAEFFEHSHNQTPKRSYNDVLNLLNLEESIIPNIYLMKLKNTSELELNQKYNLLIDNNIIKIMHENVNGLIYLLTVPSVNDIEKTLFIVKSNSEKSEYERNLKALLLNATYVFNKKEGENFIKNLILLKKYQIDFMHFVKVNPKFLFSDNVKIAKQIKLLENNNYDVKKVLLNSSISLISYEKNSEHSFLEENIEILENFSVDMNLFFNETEEVYSLLNYKPSSLVKRLIFLIELSLTDEIYDNYNHLGTSIKSFIIKRLHYAYKNSIPLFDEFETEFKRIKNKPFESVNGFSTANFTKKEYELLKKDIGKNVKYKLNESDILYLKNKYPLLDLIDEQHRTSIFSETNLALVKRKQELIMGNQIISRIKFFNIFNYLITRYDIYTSLFISLINDTILEEYEYDEILKLIDQYMRKNKEINNIYKEKSDNDAKLLN